MTPVTGTDKLWRLVVICAPYLWLLIFFLLPFLFVLKISLADPIVALPPVYAAVRSCQGRGTLVPGHAG